MKQQMISSPTSSKCNMKTIRIKLMKNLIKVLSQKNNLMMQLNKWLNNSLTIKKMKKLKTRQKICKNSIIWLTSIKMEELCGKIWLSQLSKISSFNSMEIVTKIAQKWLKVKASNSDLPKTQEQSTRSTLCTSQQSLTRIRLLEILRK